MERKVPPPPPPRGFGAPPAGVQAPFARRSGPPSAFPPATSTSEQSAPPPPPQQPHAPQSFGFQGARAPVNTSAGATRRGWRPGRVGGRHDSPLYGKHRKRPSSSSIDSNVSWSGSEIEGFGAAQAEQEQVSRLSWASSVAAKEEAQPPAAAAPQDIAPASSLFGAPAVEQVAVPAPAAVESELETKQETGIDAGQGVQPPKTPLGKPTQDDDGAISAAQRVRMELSAHAGSRAGSRSNSSENMFANITPPVYDEEKNGPQSCPSTFNSTKQPQFSIDKLRQLRSNELVASKLLPTRTSVNSLMGYVRELQLSEATLRKQLVKTKQHTEEELSHSLSKVSELEKTMQEVERDREEARRKLEEQEKLIRDLAAKLKQAEAAKARSSASASVDELPPIAEEVTPQVETPVTGAEQPPIQEAQSTEESTQTPVPPTQPSATSQNEGPMPPLHPDQPKDISRSAQFGLASPRSPNRPLWDPWASGGATPMKNLPPVFNIGSTGLDPVASSSMVAATTADSSAAGDYELKSVLMSPRRAQGQGEAPRTGDSAQMEQTESTLAHPEQDPSPQFPAPVFNVGAMPYPQEQDVVSAEMKTDSQSVLTLQEAPPSREEPMLSTPPLDRNSLEAREETVAAAQGDVAGWSDFPAQQDGHPGMSSAPLPSAANTVESNEGMTPHPPTAASAITPPPENAPPPANAPNVVTASSEHVSNTHFEPVPADSVSSGAMDAPPLGASLPPSSSAPKAETPTPPSPKKKETKTVATEPVSLETLLVDFFTEVDKKRLKMAKVYGKRYAGREKFLFTELTKRYGAAKVAALKACFENGSSSGESGSNNSTSSQTIKGATNGETSTKSSEAPAPQKPGRLGHPRHPQFFHPPTPASNVDLSGNMPPVPPPVVPVQENEALGSQVPETANGVVMPPSPSGKTSPGRGARVSPRQRRSGGSIPPFPGPPPPSFPTAQESNEGSESAGAAVDGPPMNGPPMMNGPPPPAQREAPAGQFNHPPPPPFAGMDSNAAPTGLRQRHNASAPAAQSQSNNATEVPAVTLEGLLKDLYKKHQPDKLKNVAIVAKQYAGKERELVGLLKGKYGALSVKHLEENLEVLERAHRARMGSKGAGKKRGCFVRTISLVFWLSVLLYFSFGAVFISFVVVDVWECHALDNDEQEPESADDCTPLQKELETFTYERVGDYVGQSHPEACFCLEWKARESALLSNLSGVDLVNLARMVPFSPDSFGAPWVASVKEQVPSQEFYDSYAKPVVDVSLDVGSFVWSSLLELAGFDEVAEKSSVVSDVVETMNDTDEVALLDEENELDTLMDSYEAGYEEVKDEGFVAEKESLGEPSDEAEVEAAVVADVSGQMPMEEGNDQIQDELQTQELQTQEPESIVTEILPVLVDEDDAVPVDEEAVLASEENTSIEPKEVMVEERAAVDSSPVGELESEVDVLMEETETSSDAGGNDSADLVDDVVTEVVSEEDGRVSNSVEEVKSEAADNDVSSASNDDVEVDASVETDEVGVAEESFEPATVDNDDGDSGIVCEESSAESEDVVEVEVLQEGLDLSYPETSVEQPDEANVEFNELPSTNLNEENEEIQAALGDNEEVSAASDEGETKVTGSDIEYGSVSVDELEVEADMVTDVTDDDEPEVEADVGMTESEAEVPSEASEVEVGIVDEESANPDDLETGEDASYGLTPSEDVEPDTAVLDGEPSSTMDVEASMLELDSELELEVVPGAEVNEDPVVEKYENSVGVDSFVGAPEEDEILTDDSVDVDVRDEEPIVTEIEAELSVATSDIAEELDVLEASTTSLSSEEAEVSDEAIVDEEAVITGEMDVGEEAKVDAESDYHVEADLTIPVEEEKEVPAEDDDAVLEGQSVEVAAKSGDVELAEMETETAGFELEEVQQSKVEGESVESAGSETHELQEDDSEETVAAPVEVEVDAEEEGDAHAENDGSPSENEAETSEDSPIDTEVVEDAEPTNPIDVEAEQSASEVELVGDMVDESVTIEATETSDDEVVAADESSEQAESQDIAEASEEESAPPVDQDVVDEEESVVDAASDDDVELTEEVSSASVDDEVTESQQELTAPATGEVESGGLASAVNEVLARLVEPFEAAKTAAPAVASESEHVVDEL